MMLGVDYDYENGEAYMKVDFTCEECGFVKKRGEKGDGLPHTELECLISKGRVFCSCVQSWGTICMRCEKCKSVFVSRNDVTCRKSLLLLNAKNNYEACDHVYHHECDMTFNSRELPINVEWNSEFVLQVKSFHTYIGDFCKAIETYLTEETCHLLWPEFESPSNIKEELAGLTNSKYYTPTSITDPISIHPVWNVFLGMKRDGMGLISALKTCYGILDDLYTWVYKGAVPL